jgi:vanillin dehydrogenase
MTFPDHSRQRLFLHLYPDISRNEIFGPALAITRIKTDEEAIAFVNRSGYGLSGAIHSRDIGRALRVARRIEASLVHINSVTIHDHAVSAFLLSARYLLKGGLLLFERQYLMGA